MKLQFIFEKELEKINLIFALMNQISDSSQENFIPKMMKRYEFISKATNYSVETIRKMLFKTKTYCYKKIKNYSYKLYYYDSNIYLNRLNNKRKKLEIIKQQNCLSKHLEVAKLIRTVAKATGNKTSAKTLSKIIKEKLGLYYSPKHLYHLIRQNKISGVTSRIFPYLKHGKYYKKPHKIGKRVIAIPIDQRDEIINKRIRYGDVEVDTVEGTKTDNKYLSTMIDRKSRRLSITIYENKQSNEFLKAVENNIENMNQEIKSITSDNGTENYDLVKLNIPWFSTNPYSSWQKGSIEQKHKQIRKFIPKGKSFKNLTQDDCDLIALVINAETYLQNTSKYKLGTTVTQEELQKYFKLLEKKDTHRIFQLW